MQKKRWADLSGCQRIGIVVGGTIQFGLLVTGLWDLSHRKPAEIRGDRRLWFGLMFINWIGPLVYFAYGRKESPFRFGCCQSGGPEVTEEAAQLGGAPID